ncbi:MAG TPA: glucose-6-phosphate dehydrogenase [Rudaea sp.]
MSPQTLPVQPFDLVIFGGTGDLAKRKLLPALLQRYVHGQIVDGTRIIGIARDSVPTEEYRKRVRADVEPLVEKDDAARAKLDAFLAMIDYLPLDATREAGWADLPKLLSEKPDNVRVFYLATAPDLFAPICARLREAGVNGNGARVVIEKPVGRDLESARAINDAVGRSFDEQHTFRIDHYLGKETVQNLIALRFANALFEPVWRSEHIDHVQITVAETIGVEQRAAYYDRSGALRDMVQNHMMQLLCMVAMEPPASLEPDAVRDEKLKVLHALKRIDAGNVAQLTVRGQYRGGAAESRLVPAYAEEVGNPHSRTETFVAIKAEIANWRWAGVPFYLRTGKRLPDRMSEIVITFRAIPHSIFAGLDSEIMQNKLVLRLQPGEGMQLCVMIKEPGPGGLRLRQVPLDMTFATAFGVKHQPDAYERLLMDVVRGNPTLFMRRDEVEAAWRWIDPILAAWSASGDAPKPYTAGTWGPSASVALIERDGRTWHEDGD